MREHHERVTGDCLVWSAPSFSPTRRATQSLSSYCGPKASPFLSYSKFLLLELYPLSYLHSDPKDTKGSGVEVERKRTERSGHIFMIERCKMILQRQNVARRPPILGGLYSKITGTYFFVLWAWSLRLSHGACWNRWTVLTSTCRALYPTLISDHCSNPKQGSKARSAVSLRGILLIEVRAVELSKGVDVSVGDDASQIHSLGYCIGKLRSVKILWCF